MLTFKQIFPKWTDFKQFLTDFTFYYDATLYTEPRILIYYTLLFRNFANSHTAFDNEVFNEMLSLTIAENFREFFITRELLDLVASKDVNELIVGIDTVTNMAENPNINGTGVVDYIGAQTHAVSKENIIDRVYTLIQKLHITEVRTEVQKYDYLFLKIIPKTIYIYEEEDEDE